MVGILIGISIISGFIYVGLWFIAGLYTKNGNNKELNWPLWAFQSSQFNENSRSFRIFAIFLFFLCWGGALLAFLLEN
jgi:hypothetical protein